QSQRAWRVALGSESVDEVASNVIVSFTEGTVGEYTKWAVGPGPVIVTATGAVWTSAPLVPAIVTAYDPALVPGRGHVEAGVPRRRAGTNEAVAPTGTA